MGAGSTVVSLIELSNTNSTKKLPPVPTISVKAFGFDSTLGGNEFDSRLQNWMVDKFVAEKTGKVKGDIRQSQRAMMKMLKKSNELKQMLSANTEMVFSVRLVVKLLIDPARSVQSNLTPSQRRLKTSLKSRTFAVNFRALILKTSLQTSGLE